jgi:hypothetical protein
MNGKAPVAQLDRALPSEGKGHTFESCRVRHFLFVLQLDTRLPEQNGNSLSFACVSDLRRFGGFAIHWAPLLQS